MRFRYYFIYFLLVIVFFGCTKPEEENITYLDATVNGNIYLFNTFHVAQQQYSELDYSYTDVTVTASLERDPDILIAFIAEKNKPGNEACWYFAYIEEGHVYEMIEDSFEFDVHESTPHRLRGLFSGQLKSIETGEVVNVTNGSFDIFYNRYFP